MLLVSLGAEALQGKHTQENPGQRYPHTHHPPLGSTESKPSDAIAAFCLELRWPAALLFFNFFSSSIALAQACKQSSVSYKKKLS